MNETSYAYNLPSMGNSIQSDVNAMNNFAAGNAQSFINVAALIPGNDNAYQGGTLATMLPNNLKAGELTLNSNGAGAQGHPSNATAAVNTTTTHTTATPAPNNDLVFALAMIELGL
jgi:hypothetical protein